MLAQLSGKFLRSNLPRRLSVALALALLSLAPVSRASAAAFKTLYSFCGKMQCRDGQLPKFGSLFVGPDGTIYGAADSGGSNNAGVFYKLVRRENGTWRQYSLFLFCKPDPGRCAGGYDPDGGVVFDVAGNAYGSAFAGGNPGGPVGGGVIYKLSPPPPGSRRWTENVLYRFCAQANCTDGRGSYTKLTYAGAETGVPYDGVSPLYGITQAGGSGLQQQGVLFSLTPPAHPQDSGLWTETVLYAFCSQQNCADGAYPFGDLLTGPDGAAYGVTNSGGIGAGVLYGFKNQTYSVLHTFCSAANCGDGAHPAGGLVMDAQGNLFGTTQRGGAHNSGTIYKLSFPGGQPALTVLYDFCAQSNCTDGLYPYSQLALDSAGRLFGTTQNGGAHGEGTVFLLDGTTFTVLHDFCSDANCADGSQPQAGPVLDGSGHLLGTTYIGGKHNAGTVWELTP